MTSELPEHAAAAASCPLGVGLALGAGDDDSPAVADDVSLGDDGLGESDAPGVSVVAIVGGALLGPPDGPDGVATEDPQAAATRMTASAKVRVGLGIDGRDVPDVRARARFTR